MWMNEWVNVQVDKTILALRLPSFPVGLQSARRRLGWSSRMTTFRRGSDHLQLWKPKKSLRRRGIGGPSQNLAF